MMDLAHHGGLGKRWLLAAVFCGGIAAGCSAGDGGNHSEVSPPAAGGGAGEENPTTGGSSSIAGSLQIGGATPGEGGAAADPGNTADLEIVTDPPNLTVLPASGKPTDVHFSVKYPDGTTPQKPAWSVDDTRIGSVDQDGVFRANGWVAGTVTVTVEAGNHSGKLELQVSVDVTENPGNLDAQTQASLTAGGSGGPDGKGPDGTFRFLYPYDETVFPRGLEAPVLQFSGSAATASMVTLEVGLFKYRAFFGASTPPRITLPAEAWRSAALSTTSSDWLTASVTKSSAGSVTGPISERYRIAQGDLKGILYYTTYKSPLAAGGAVMRLKPGGNAEVLIAGCTVCHSVSSRGNVLAAGVNWPADNPDTSGAWSLDANGAAKPLILDPEGRKYSLGALTPEGKYMMTNAVPAGGNEVTLPRGLLGPYSSRLIETATGKDVATSGWSYGDAETPSFSPDGKWLAFTRGGPDLARVLSVVSFDATGSAPAFANERNVLSSPDKILSWPQFLPDSGGLLYQTGEAFDTSWGSVARYAEIGLIDLATNTEVPIPRLNGYDDKGVTYLPYGEAEEAHVNYEATVLPVPVGGFYWVLFTSRRAYGNTLAPGGTDGGTDKWGTKNDPSVRKKIWLAALDLDYATKGKGDPSHPASYLPGQELAAGNMRAFAALEPCRANGKSCESGAECCDGFCRETSKDAQGNPVLQCVPPPQSTCSHVGETCQSAGDCCDMSNLCINHRCAVPAPRPPR